MVETLYYFIKLDGGTLGGIDVEKTTTIGDVCDIIYEREHISKNHSLSPGQLDLYAPTELSRKPVNNLRQRVSELTLGDILDIGDEVKEIFKTGLDRNLVHIVIVPQRTGATGRPRTSIIPEGTRRDTREETQKLVDDFWGENDAGLAQFLVNRPWNDFWKAPQSAPRDTASFIDDLRIPQISGSPVLLLHDLGEKSTVDQGIVDNLFGGRSRFLVNTSGSGKTRLLFEGLVRHWGFYFTTVSVPNSTNYGLGSMDMMDAIHRYIPNSRSFTHQPESLHKDLRDAAYRANHSVAERRVRQVFAARVLIFERFLKMAQAMCPTRDINEFKMHWLFLQLRPMDLVGGDIFAILSEILKDATDEYLMARSRTHQKLFDMQYEFGLNKRFFFVLDEAQEAIEHLHGCFRSQNDASIKRPILRPIIDTWENSSVFPMIVSGTSLSLDVVNEVMGSAVGKPRAFTLVTETGAFDDAEAHRKYILRYMPDHVAKSTSGEEFLRRTWGYLRGRHRFTASLLTQLLKCSFRSPHKILNEYVEVFCGFLPSDGLDFVNKEEDIHLQQGTIPPFDFSKIREDSERIKIICRALFAWLLERQVLDLPDEHRLLVELGFARFINNPMEKAIVDEPLVLLAATREICSETAYSLEAQILDGLGGGKGRDEYFKAFVAYYLACAFDDESKPCDIFNFGDVIPEWAKQHAELVSVVVKDEGIEVHPFHLLAYIDSKAVIGFTCKEEEETIGWFKKPVSLMCFPDQNMGPDIVLFIRLPDGQKLAVGIQCKWRSLHTLPPSVVNPAVSSIDHTKYYGGTGRDKCKAINEAISNLLGSEANFQMEWLEDGVPMLKVIASYPATAKPVVNDGMHVASLNMDRCVALVDKKGLLEAVKASLGLLPRKRPVESDDADSSSKKTRR